MCPKVQFKPLNMQVQVTHQILQLKIFTTEVKVPISTDTGKSRDFVVRLYNKQIAIALSFDNYAINK